MVNKMKSTLSDLIATQARIDARKPKRHARGEGIRDVRKWVSMQSRMFDGFISGELAAQIEAEWIAAREFEPMLGDTEFQRDMGLV